MLFPNPISRFFFLPENPAVRLSLRYDSDLKKRTKGLQDKSLIRMGLYRQPR